MHACNKDISSTPASRTPLASPSVQPVPATPVPDTLVPTTPVPATPHGEASELLSSMKVRMDEERSRNEELFKKIACTFGTPAQGEGDTSHPATCPS